MLRVGCTAAVAAPQNLVSRQQAVGDADSGALERILLRYELANDREVFGDSVRKDARQVQRRWHALLVSDNEFRGSSQDLWEQLLLWNYKRYGRAQRQQLFRYRIYFPRSGRRVEPKPSRRPLRYPLGGIRTSAGRRRRDCPTESLRAQGDRGHQSALRRPGAVLRG